MTARRNPTGWKKPSPELVDLIKKYIKKSHAEILADPEITDHFKIGQIMASLIDIQATNVTIDQALQDPDKDLEYLRHTRAALKIVMSYDQTRLDVVNERIRLILQADEPGGTQEAPGAKIPEPPGQQDQESEEKQG